MRTRLISSKCLAQSEFFKDWKNKVEHLRSLYFSYFLIFFTSNTRSRVKEFRFKNWFFFISWRKTSRYLLYHNFYLFKKNDRTIRPTLSHGKNILQGGTRTRTIYSYLSDSERYVGPFIRVRWLSKKKLEKHFVMMIDRKTSCSFQTPYKERKVNFYQKITRYLKEERNDMEKMICEITKDILFIYDKKKEEMNIWIGKSIQRRTEISHREEERIHDGRF